MESPKINIDFFGIGSAKSGTSFVARCLDEHPKICLSKPKEINFFNNVYPSYLAKQKSNYQKGFNWYKKHFRHCANGNIRGEFSVYYLPDKNVVDLILSNYPNTKIIAVFRNPVERAFSHYKFRKAQPGKIKYKSFEDALQTSPEFIEWGFYFKLCW